MPLNVVSLTTIEGLVTEASEIDPGKRPPNSLYDCRNVAFPKEGAATARKGFPVALDATSTNSSSSYIVAMNEIDSGKIQVIWGNTATSTNTSLWDGVASSAFATSLSTVTYTGTPTANIRASGDPAVFPILAPFTHAWGARLDKFTRALVLFLQQWTFQGGHRQ
jgi:hypothetical protein